MQKTRIAVAALAALTALTTTAAMAQSSVQVYGRVDASIGSQDINGTSTSSLFNGSDGGLTGSRLGFQGTEDLGGGVKAIFRLEHRFNVDTGLQTNSSVFWQGESWVGLSSGLGTVKLGRTYTSFDDIRAMAVAEAVYDSAFTPTGLVYGGRLGNSLGAGDVGLGDYTSRGANQLRYESPNISGFTAGFSYAFDENAPYAAPSVASVAPLGAVGTAARAELATLAGNRLGSVAAVNVRYRSGPIDVGVARQSDTDVKGDYTALSGTYNFGVAKVALGLNRRASDVLGGDLKDSEYTLGVTVPVGAMNFSLGYASAETKLDGFVIDEASGFGLGATYALSKRTRLYAGYRDVEFKANADLGIAKADRSLYAVGVRHDF